MLWVTVPNAYKNTFTSVISCNPTNKLTYAAGDSEWERSRDLDTLPQHPDSRSRGLSPSIQAARGRGSTKIAPDPTRKCEEQQDHSQWSLKTSNLAGSFPKWKQVSLNPEKDGGPESLRDTRQTSVWFGPVRQWPHKLVRQCRGKALTHKPENLAPNLYKRGRRKLTPQNCPLAS